MKAGATTPRQSSQAIGQLSPIASDALSLTLIGDERVIVELVSDSDDNGAEAIPSEVSVDIVAEFQCEV